MLGLQGLLGLLESLGLLELLELLGLFRLLVLSFARLTTLLSRERERPKTEGGGEERRGKC